LQQFISDFRGVPAERHSDTFKCPEQIHNQGSIRTAWVLKKNCRPSFSHNPLRDFSGFKNRIHLRAHTLQLAMTLKMLNEALQVSERHNG
jgi:hypothetical protein